MKFNILLTFSGSAGSGKDTFVKMVKEELDNLLPVYCPKYLQECLMWAVDSGMVLTSFSIAYGDFLKSVCARNFGYTEENKSEFRSILQYFGTDVVRKHDEYSWVLPVEFIIDAVANNTPCRIFFVTDARYNNELVLDDLIPSVYAKESKSLSVVFDKYNILVKGSDHRNNELTEEQKKHSSESLANTQDDYIFYDIIENNGTLEDLQEKAREIAFAIIDWLEEDIEE